MNCISFDLVSVAWAVLAAHVREKAAENSGTYYLTVT